MPDAGQPDLPPRRLPASWPDPRLLMLSGNAHVRDNKTIAVRPRHRFRLRHPKGSKWSVDLSKAQAEHPSESHSS